MITISLISKYLTTTKIIFQLHEILVNIGLEAGSEGGGGYTSYLIVFEILNFDSFLTSSTVTINFFFFLK